MFLPPFTKYMLPVTYLANQLIDYCLQLNSWQESRLNEPDFELRDDGYKEAIHILAEPELDVNFLLMIVHNCCYFTTTVSLVFLPHFTGRLDAAAS